MDTLALVVVVAAALLFTYTNGRHDSAGSLAAVVSTRALTPRVALAMAAVLNLAGAFLGSGVARTVSEELIDPPTGRQGLLILLAGLLSALAWNVLALRVGLTTSSSHALFGGLVGATLASAGTVRWDGVLGRVLLPMVVAPLVALALGYAVMVALLWACRNANPHRAQRGFRMAQAVGAAAGSLAHGLQDAQKTMGVVVLALVVAEADTGGPGWGDVPLWVRVACAVALAAGTYAGGWHVVRGLGRRVIALDPPRGFAAESAAASVLYGASYLFHAPVSSSHVLTSAVVGAGATRRLKAVRWGVATSVLTGWLLALPAAAAMGVAGHALLALLLS